MARWQTLDSLLVDFRKQGRERFLAGHPHPVLLVEVASHDDEDDTNTEDITSNRLHIPEDLSPQQLRLVARARGFRVLTIVKCEHNKWPDRITIGRSRVNDLVLAHRTVSKVHAYFQFLESGRATLTDGGSRNGTRLNSAKLKPDRTATLEPLDKLTFGGLTTTFHPARNLADFLALLGEP